MAPCKNKTIKGHFIPKGKWLYRFQKTMRNLILIKTVPIIIKNHVAKSCRSAGEHY